ncbi:MAG TPA: hypothetical protein DHV36_11105 [Desulfobacteraceae bacterium]|nr:hypothetical protein [Desulfobacteraceae bacterium]
MKLFYIVSLLSFIIAVSFVVFAGQGGVAKTQESEHTDRMSNSLPPMDLNPPGTFETASFGLG